MTTTTTLDANEIALDPLVHPERFDGVRTRRIFAFLIDAMLVAILMAVVFIVIAVLGFFTFGLAWFFIPAIWPVVAILYSVLSVGGSTSATPGMRLNGIEIRTVSGGRPDYLLALLHALGFWFSASILTPFILLVSLFTERKQLLHDLILGTQAVRSR